MSPEQVSEEADARSDLWSLGVVLYEMVAGRVPFHGAYAEAVAYAIRTEHRLPCGRSGPTTQALEQLVFRTLHKEPSVRFQSARDLSRALRMLQGRTMAQDLLTEPLPDVRRKAPALPPAPPQRWRRTAAIVAAVLAVVAAGAYPLLTRAVDRVPVAIAPVVNQTGYAELDPYRLALTQVLVSDLAESPNIRVVPYTRLLQIVRRFVTGGTDMSSREAIQALTAGSGAGVVVIPTLLYENGAWRGRAEIQDAATGTMPPCTTPSRRLVAGQGHRLCADRGTGAGVQRASWNYGPVRIYAARRIGPAADARRCQGLRGRAERVRRIGVSSARAAFARAADQDSRNPLMLAWLSRVAQVFRDETPPRTPRSAPRAW